MPDREMTFPEGLRVFWPHENTPDFVKAEIVLDVAELRAWLDTVQTDDQGRVRLDVKESARTGNLYASVNTYVPRERPADVPGAPAAVDGKDDDIPF